MQWKINISTTGTFGKCWSRTLYRQCVQARCTDQVCMPGVQTRCTGQVCRPGVHDRCTCQVCTPGVQTKCTGQVCRPCVHSRCPVHLSIISFETLKIIIIVIITCEEWTCCWLRKDDWKPGSCDLPRSSYKVYTLTTSLTTDSHFTLTGSLVAVTCWDPPTKCTH